MADGVELATGYVSLTTEAATLTKQIRKAAKDAFKSLDINIEGLKSLPASAKSAGKKAKDEFDKAFEGDLPKIKAPEVEKPTIPTPDVPTATISFDTSAVGDAFGEINRVRSELLKVASVDISDPVKKFERDLEVAASSGAIRKLESELAELGNKAKIDGKLDIDGANRVKDLLADVRKLESEAGKIDLDVSVGAVDTSSLVDDITDAGEDAANGFLGSFSPPLLGGIVTLGTGIAAILIGSVSESLSREAQTDALGASLGMTPEQAESFGYIAGEVYGNAYGDSFSDVLETSEFAAPLLSGGLDLEAIIVNLENFETVFGGTAEEYSAFLTQLNAQGVIDSNAVGFDLLAASLQQVPKAYRDNFTEAVGEYAIFGDAVGLQSEEIFAFFAGYAEQGPFAIDKAGDALKEFTILTAELGEDQVNAFEAIGLSAETTSAVLARGGPDANKAFGQIVDGLLRIEDPAEQAIAAVALFGEPLNDLGRENIPDFLEQLQGAEDGLGDFEGAANQIDIDANDNGLTRLTELWRGFKESLIDVADEIAPLTDVGIAFVEEFQAIMGEEGIGAAVDFAVEQLGELYDLAKPYLDDFVEDAEEWAEAELLPRLTTALETAGEAFIDWIKPTGPEVLEALNGFGTSVLDWVDLLPGKLAISFLAAKDEFVGWAQDSATDAISTLVGKIPDIVQAGKDFLKGLLDGATFGLIGVTLFFIGVPGKIKTAIGNVTTTLLQAGKDVIAGFLDGIKAKWTEVTAWLSSNVPSVEGIFNRVLQRQSPSKVMRSVGEDTIAGFRIGMEAEQPAVEATITNVADAVISPLANLRPYTPDFGSGTTSSAAGPPVEVHVNSQFVDSAAFAKASIDTVRHLEARNGSRFLAPSDVGAG